MRLLVLAAASYCCIPGAAVRDEEKLDAEDDEKGEEDRRGCTGSDMVAQCIGGEKWGRIQVNCFCPHDRKKIACPRDSQSVKSMRYCNWPQTSQYAGIGKPPFFDWSPVAHGPTLHGIRSFTPEDKKTLLQHGLQLMTDMDDTLEASGSFTKGGVGGAVAGIDNTLDRHTIYPGVVKFYHSLAVSLQDHEDTTKLKVLPFSARPEKFKAMLGMKGCEGIDLIFRQKICECPDKGHCVAGKCECFGFNIDGAAYGKTRDAVKEIVPDLLKRMQEYALQGERSESEFVSMGGTKAKNYFQIRGTLIKDTPAIFIGDNGQGDLVAAQMMLTLSQNLLPHHPQGAVLAAFIHDVRQSCDSDCRGIWANQNIFFFTDYREAAGIAIREGLMKDTAMAQIEKDFAEG